MELEKKERVSALDGFRTYTLTELEPVIGVSHRTLLEYVKLGKIKASKIGQKWRVKEEDLKSFLDNSPKNC